MKAIVSILVATMILSSATTTAHAPKIRSQREIRREMRAAARTGDYYVETKTIIRLVPKTDKTRGLKRRDMTIYLRPKSKNDSTIITMNKI